MKALKSNFKKNGLRYTLIQRNKVAAIFGVGGNYTDKILHYEVCRIKFNADHEMHGNKVLASESIASNEEFGKEKSLAILGLDEAKKYYTWLTGYLNLNTEGRKHYVEYDKRHLGY
jgi:hypothetical protein